MINQNLKDGNVIYSDFYGKDNGILNSIVNVYMLGALGSFDSEAYGNGYNKTLTMTMFILGTYVIQVIFMNMLICIMSDTFTRV